VTKQEFVDAVAGKSGLSKRDAGAAVDAFLETVEETLKAGDTVNFTGFGKFHTTHRAARMGVNPRNPSEKVQIVSTQPELPVRCCTTQAPAISTESDAAMATSALRYNAVMKNPGWTSNRCKIR